MIWTIDDPAGTRAPEDPSRYGYDADRSEHDPEEQHELDAATDSDAWLDELREVF